MKAEQHVCGLLMQVRPPARTDGSIMASLLPCGGVLAHYGGSLLSNAQRSCTLHVISICPMVNCVL